MHEEVLDMFSLQYGSEKVEMKARLLHMHDSPSRDRLKRVGFLLLQPTARGDVDLVQHSDCGTTNLSLRFSVGFGTGAPSVPLSAAQRAAHLIHI